MDLESINNKSRHVRSVPRIESRFSHLSPDEIDSEIETKKREVFERWASCHRGFVTLFKALNYGERQSQDSFDIKLQHEDFDADTYDTYVRIWHDRRRDTYSAKPYIIREGHIRDDEYPTESFGGDYTYTYGTRNSKSARLHAEHDDTGTEIKLERVNGYPAGDMTLAKKSIFLAALEDLILPGIENSENTLATVWGSALNENMNPELSQKVRQFYGGLSSRTT